MHIIILPSEYFVTKKHPTAGIFQFDQAKIFIEKGNAVGVLAVKPYFTVKEYIRGLKTIFVSRFGFGNALKRIIYLLFPVPFALNEENLNGINVFRFQGSYGLIRTQDSAGRLEKWKKMGDYAMARYIKKYGRPDVMHAHNMVYAGMMGNYLSNKYSIPIVVTERSSEHLMRDLPDVLESMISKHFQEMNNLNAVSPSFVKQLERKYSIEEDKVKWFPNVIDRVFEDENVENQSSGGKFVFLNVANLIPIKGQEEMIRAFGTAFKNDNGVVLKIAGDGYLRQHLESVVSELGLTNVEFLGFLRRERVVDEMRKCNVLLLPSYYETFGVVLIEALALGKPVIASKCGGPECIVDSTNGLLFECRNTEQLTHSLKEIKENYREYDHQKIKRDVIKRFGREEFYKRIRRIYETAINDYNC